MRQQTDGRLWIAVALAMLAAILSAQHRGEGIARVHDLIGAASGYASPAVPPASKSRVPVMPTQAGIHDFSVCCEGKSWLAGLHRP